MDDYANYPSDAEAEAELQSDQGWAPMHTQHDPQQTRWEMSPDDILEYFEHELRGENWNYSTKTWDKDKDSNPILNEKGIRVVISEIRAVVNKISFLSNLSEAEIYEIVLTVSNNLTQNIFNNGEDMGVDWSTGFQSTIVDKVANMVFIGLKKAQGQGERQYRTRIEKVLRRVDEGPRREEKKSSGRLFG